MTDQQQKRLDTALRHSQHPIFQRSDITQLAEYAFQEQFEQLWSLELSASEVDALLTGLNIGGDWF